MVLKYFIIGIIFTFLVELLFNRLVEHPLIKDKYKYIGKKVKKLLFYPKHLPIKSDNLSMVIYFF